MGKKDTTVGAHFKPSLGRVVDTYTRQQDVTKSDHSTKPPPPKSALAALADTKKNAEGKLVFPVDAYKPPKRRWWRDLSGRSELSTATAKTTFYGLDEHYWTYRRVNRRGEGVVRADNIVTNATWHEDMCRGTQTIGPDQLIYESLFRTHKDYSNTNMERLRVLGGVTSVSWAGANLRDAEFAGDTADYVTDVSFDGADLTGGKITGMYLVNVTMRGADLTGFTFDIPPESHISRRREKEFALDATDSNITGEQFDAVREKLNLISNRSPEALRVRRHTPQEFMALTGVDEEELTVLLWTGEIEHRSLTDDKQADGEFDASRHYIPQWEAQRLINERATAAQ